MKNILVQVPKSIQVDGTQVDSGRYQVLINSQPVYLTPKSFKYFVVLAYHLEYTQQGWVHFTNIEVGDNQARYLYRLKNELLDGIDWPWYVFLNNRRGYYRLNARPGSINFNRDNIRAFPDYEITALLD